MTNRGLALGRQSTSLSPVPAQTYLITNEHPLKLQFGATIRKRRHQLGLTQDALTKRAGMHRTYLADLESGRRNAALTNIAAMAGALGLSLAGFFRRMERTPPPVRKRFDRKLGVSIE